jgi:predicted nucleic acid-binding protein
MALSMARPTAGGSGIRTTLVPLPHTRSGAEFDLIRADREQGYEWLATHDQDWHRALDVQGTLWRTGHVRAVGFPGLLIAAVAEREQVTLVHYDLIAQVTTQPMQWIVPRGTVP